MRLPAFLAAVLLALLPPGASAQPLEAQEHEVKAAFLSKFPAFVEWPNRPGPETPFVIAVAGAPETAAALRRLTDGRRHDGRPIEVREAEPAQDVSGAQMVFVGRAAATRVPLIARSLAGAPTLVVSESPGGLEQGSMINFVVYEARVRFDVAPEVAEARGLRISSRLLAVARNVRGAK